MKSRLFHKVKSESPPRRSARQLPLDEPISRHDRNRTMSDNTGKEISINLTDDEFVKLHAVASAEGVEVNDFIVATLRKHAKIAAELETLQQNNSSTKA